MKKIIILGGTGFIGKNLLIHYSKKKNYKVYATYFRSEKFYLNNVTWIKADLRIEKNVKKVTKNIDIVIQAAATTSGAKDVVNSPYIQVKDNAIMNSLLLRSFFDN